MTKNEGHNRKGIYILPSLFTTAGLFFGFYAIINASQGIFDKADHAESLIRLTQIMES